MEFVYLKKTKTEHGVRFLPKGDNDEIALLKARTLLYILAEKRLLDKEVVGNIVFYTPSNKTAVKSLALPGLNTSDPEIEAVIPILPFKRVWEQPGIAYVLGGLENETLFLNYLMQSKRWLDHNPISLNEIETKLMEVAS